MTEKLGFIERTQKRSLLRNGRKLTPAELGGQIGLCGDDVRVDILEEFQADEDLTLAERISYGRELYGVHERKREAGR